MLSVRSIGSRVGCSSGRRTASRNDAKPLPSLGPDVFEDEHLIEFWKSGVLVAVGVDVGGGYALDKEKAVAQAAMARL